MLNNLKEHSVQSHYKASNMNVSDELLQKDDSVSVSRKHSGMVKFLGPPGAGGDVTRKSSGVEHLFSQRDSIDTREIHGSVI